MKTILLFAAVILFTSASGQKIQKVDTSKYRINRSNSRIEFTVIDSTMQWISFSEDGKITHFPKDSMTAIIILWKEIKKEFDKRHTKQ